MLLRILPHQKFHLIQYYEKLNKKLNDIAKVATKSEKLTPFGKIFLIMK